jgi:hypothetical protein
MTPIIFKIPERINLFLLEIGTHLFCSQLFQRNFKRPMEFKEFRVMLQYGNRSTVCCLTGFIID